MKTKRLGDLERGDKIRTVEPDGIGRVTEAGHSGMALAVKVYRGRSIEIRWINTDGPSKGKEGWHIGAADDEVTLA